MRIAFWWKLNWSWFCLIQCSYDEAVRPIDKSEIEPFPDAEAINNLAENEMDVEMSSSAVKKEETTSISATPHSSDQDTISEPMEDVLVARTIPSDIPHHLRRYWEMAKRLNARPPWPLHLGEDEWIEIGDLLVEFGNELAIYGLIDMDLGLWENEILHRTVFR